MPAAIVVSLVSLVGTVLAMVNDARAFAAVASPALWWWVALSAACAVAISVIASARRARVRVPWHLRLALLAGVASGLLALPTVVPVLTKREAEPVTSIAGERADLREQSVQDASFAEADLRRALLSRAVLHHVDLSGADLSEADLRSARLRDVDLSGAELCGVDLRGADLRGALGLESVESWDYVYYDRTTRMPPDYDISVIPGPVPDTGRDLLTMCETNVTRRIAN